MLVEKVTKRNNITVQIYMEKVQLAKLYTQIATSVELATDYTTFLMTLTATIQTTHGATILPFVFRWSKST